MTNFKPAEGDSTRLQLSVMIPARNEAALIRECSAWLVRQSEEDFSLGRDRQRSSSTTARTGCHAQIATEFAGRTVLEAPALRKVGQGKRTHCGLRRSRRGSGCYVRMQIRCMKRAIFGAPSMRRNGIKMRRLPIPPRQVVRGMWQRMLTALIFADLAQVYPPRLVNLPESRVAAANGQFLLIQRDVYCGSAGTRLCVARELTMSSWRLVKRSGERCESVRPDAVMARSYRSLGEMAAWKRNLVLLFPDALPRIWKLFQAVLLFGLPLLRSGCI